MGTPIEILYLDNDLAAVIKPRGVLSELGKPDESLPAMLFAEIGRVFPVHRLDRVVGGVMIYARTAQAAAALSKAAADGGLHKTYIAVTEGRPKAHCGEFSDYLYKDSAANKAFAVDTPRHGARKAVLRYRIIQSTADEAGMLSKIEVTPLTGRSHQIRVQFASRGMPLFGDGKYGSRRRAPYPALYAVGLSLLHPITGKPLDFRAPLPCEIPYSYFKDVHNEIERKFLIAFPDTAALSSVPGCVIRHISQIYLTSIDGETRRIRRTEPLSGGAPEFYYTRKQRVSPIRCIEEEQKLTETEYRELLRQADPLRNPIEKIRYAVPTGKHTAEIDIYPFWSDRAVAEVELSFEEESFTLPSDIRVIREITEDFRYKNANLAKEVPNEPI